MSFVGHGGPHRQGVHHDREQGHDDALVAAIAHDGPALVEVIADPELV